MAGWAVGTRIGVGKTFSLQYALVRHSLRLCGTQPPDSAGLRFALEDSDPVLVSKPRGRSISHQMRAKLQRCAERVHGAKDEDDAPWTNLFTVHGLAPNHPVGRRTRKAGAPFFVFEIENSLRPRGDRRPTNLFSLRAIEQSIRASRCAYKKPTHLKFGTRCVGASPFCNY
jgi:hypothetical protein